MLNSLHDNLYCIHLKGVSVSQFVYTVENTLKKHISTQHLLIFQIKTQQRNVKVFHTLRYYHQIQHSEQIRLTKNQFENVGRFSTNASDNQSITIIIVMTIIIKGKKLQSVYLYVSLVLMLCRSAEIREPGRKFIFAFAVHDPGW